MLVTLLFIIRCSRFRLSSCVCSNNKFLALLSPKARFRIQPIGYDRCWKVLFSEFWEDSSYLCIMVELTLELA